MAPVHVDDFTYGGVRHEVPTSTNGSGDVVQARENKPLGSRYSVTGEAESGFDRYRGAAAVDELAKLAKNDAVMAYGMGPVHIDEFTYEHVRYEVRTSTDGLVYVIQVFENGRPIGLRYSVMCERQSDFDRYVGASALDELVEIAKNNVLLGHVNG